MPTRQAPGGRSAQPPPTPGRRRAARTRGARGGRRAGGADAGLPRGAGGSPPDRQTGTEDAKVRRRRRRARAGRKRAKVTSPRDLRGGCAFSFSRSFFLYFKAFSGFFLSFSFFFRLLSLNAAGTAATRGGERRLGEPPLHLYPPAPGAAGRRAPRDLGAVVPAHSARGPEAGRPRESDPSRPRGATATPGVRRTAPLGPPSDLRAAFQEGELCKLLAPPGMEPTNNLFYPPSRIMFIINVFLTCKGNIK